MAVELKLELKVTLEDDELPQLGEIANTLSEAIAQLQKPLSPISSSSSGVGTVSSYGDNEPADLSLAQIEKAVGPLNPSSKEFIRFVVQFLVQNGKDSKFSDMEKTEWIQKWAAENNNNYSKVGTAATKRVRSVTKKSRVCLFKWKEIYDDDGVKDWICILAPETFKNLQLYFSIAEQNSDDQSKE